MKKRILVIFVLLLTLVMVDCQSADTDASLWAKGNELIKQLAIDGVQYYVLFENNGKITASASLQPPVTMDEFDKTAMDILLATKDMFVSNKWDMARVSVTLKNEANEIVCVIESLSEGWGGRFAFTDFTTKPVIRKYTTLNELQRMRSPSDKFNDLVRENDVTATY